MSSNQTSKKKVEKDCCFNNIDKAKRIGRCNYVCVVCGKNVSLLVFYYEQLKVPSSKVPNSKRVKKQ